MADRIYCYPDSDVLKNKIGIRDMGKLQQVEKRLTMLRILELIDNPVLGKFDLEHLKMIHRYIFQDVYVNFIEGQAAEIFRKLRDENYLQGLSNEDAAGRLAYYFSEINALHPFREGNGRSQREFIRTLALHIGYVINFANASKEEMIKASEDSFLCDYGRMEHLFAKCIKRKL